MADPYAKFQKTASRLLKKWKQGRVTVIRNVDGDPPPPDWPTWEAWPDNSRREVYELDAVVAAVSDRLVGGEGISSGDVIKATDLSITCSHKMMLVEVDGAPVAPVPVKFDTGLLDTLNIDGRPLTIVRDISAPAAGTPVAHRYVVRG